MSKKKRILIFSFYNKKGKIYEYVFHLLNQYRQITEYIIFVANGILCEESRSKLNCVVDEIVIRKNEGYDGEAYRKIVLQLIEQEKIWNYDELILSNDTYFGPLRPWHIIFSSSNIKETDFWGLTRWNGGYSELLETYVPEHVQGYFIVIKKNILQSEVWFNFWKTMPIIKTYKDAVVNYEIGLTSYLVAHGFKYDVWLEENKSNGNIYLQEPYKIIKDYGFPIIKRKAVSILNEQGIKAVEYIRNYCDYDISMIEDYKREMHENPFEVSNLKSFCKKYHNIYLYGNGKWARSLTYYLNKIGVKIKKYIVTEYTKDDDLHEVVEYHIGLIKRDEGVIIAIKDYEAVYELLIKAGLKNQILKPWDNMN